MKISKEKLKQIIKEELDLAKNTPMVREIDGVDQEGRMAKRQLTDIHEYSGQLCEMLSDDTQLEAWVQAKLTLAADYIKTVKHYLEYEAKDGQLDQVMPHMGDDLPPMP